MQVNKKLIIVESPTKARTLLRFLGEDYDVEATMGHIMDLPKSKLGIEIEKDFKPDYVEVVKRKDTIESLKSKSKKADAIYIASDPDREGEAIASHVKELIDGKKSKRITFHEITKDAVTEALANPREIDSNLVDAQIGRRVLDRLVGYKLSPLLWKKVRRGLSAGRVQSVAVRLIVEKEREIEKFRSDEYWEIFADVKKSKNNFVVTLIKIDGKKAEVQNKETADQILSDLEKANYRVLEVKRREVRKNPYPPFTTSTMTQAGARLFGWSSKKTMSLAQKLYEEGLITYHRTDSFNLNAKAVESARAYVTKQFGNDYLPETPRLYKTNSKSAQEAHEAIRPTDVKTRSSSAITASDKFGADEEKLYDLIWRRFVACQMSASVYDETTIDVEADKYILRAGGQVIKFTGWREVLPGKKDANVAVELPSLIKGDDLELKKVWGDQKFTLPPARFNEASLIKMLEKLGIGRPSTYAPTISTIQVRTYVEKNDSKQFIPTSVGIAVNDFLIQNFPDTFDYQFTAGMEAELDDIANGKIPWVKAIKDFWNPFEKKLEDVEKNSIRVKIETEKLGRSCPDCDEARATGDETRTGELVIRTGRFGKFISCSLFPNCKHTEKLIQKINMKCPDCNEGDVIVKKSKRGRKFFGCSRYPVCKYASWKSPLKEEN